MISHKFVYRSYLLTLSFFLTLQSYSQDILESEPYSRHGYIYKLSDKQAKTFFEEEKPEYNTTYFQTLVDSFPVNAEYRKNLKQGYYLKVKIVENKVETDLTAVQDFNLFIFNNDKDLNLSVLNLDGEPIKNAGIKLKNKTIPFDPKTQTYSLHKNYKDGIISLTYNGHTFYYDLEKSDRRSFLKRQFISAVYGTPIKYVWKPVKFVIDLPIDAYKSIRHGYGTKGTINQVERFAVNLYESVACWFDKYYCDEPKTFGYAITDKPKYRPNDSVKFKAYLLNKRYKTIDKPLEIYLQKSYRDKKKLGEISPYADGGYTFEFQLSDSLNLKLDKRYSLVLKDKSLNEYDRAYFYYEDYTLKGNSAKITSKTQTQYKGDSLAIYIEAKDENDLNLMDARAKILLKPTGDYKVFANKIFIPDTLWQINKTLKPRGKTKINIPPDIFPEANLDYEVSVVVKTSDNESTATEKRFSYVYENVKVESKLTGDTLRFSYTQNGKELPAEGNLYIKDQFENTDSILGLNLPYKHKINPYHYSYRMVVDSLENLEKLKDHPDNVTFNYKRTADSISIDVSNPRSLGLLYHVYKINTQMDEGQASTNINLKYAVNSKKNYFFSLSYLWAGEIVEKNYALTINESQLNLQVSQSGLIYPGKTDTISIKVTDFKNEPVEDVDLSAYGITKKFDYEVPRLPNLQKYRKQKKIINNYDFTNKAFNLKDYDLNIDEWEQKAGLDSIIYYDFMYPKGVFETTVPVEDNVTQFAAFVMKDGKQEDIKVIYVDNNPVYTSWNGHTQSYSFPIDFGYHDIKLRTGEYEYQIDSIYFPMYRKTILSVDSKANSPKVKTRFRGAELTALERRQLYPRMLFYHEHEKNFLAYINTEDQFFLIDKPENGYYNSSRPKITGPIYRDFQFRTYDSLQFNLTHEPGFSYDFYPEYVKLKSFDNTQLPKYFSNKNQPKSLNDKALTKEIIQTIWKQKIIKRRRDNSYKVHPYKTTADFATLKLIDTKPNPDKYIINIIIVNKKRDDFRLYSGYQNEFFELKPESYRVIFLFQDMTYQVLDEIDLKANGLNVLKFSQPEEYLVDFMSSAFNEILNDAQLDIDSNNRYREHVNRLKKAYNENEQYFGPGYFVSGVVRDRDGLPIPGVNVIIKGTTMGTQTDFDGRYIIKVPSMSDKIVFSYVGFKTKETSPSQSTTIINLEPDSNALDEVVVTAYGTTERNAMSSAVVSYDASQNFIQYDALNVNFYFENPSMDILKDLQGKVAGVNITNSSGSVGNGTFVRIRGVGSINESSRPLFVVDGVPITKEQYLSIAQDNIGSITILKDASATALYGSQGANGVVIISSKTGVPELQGNSPMDIEGDFYAENSAASSIRTNFSDVAYWQPQLRTDENGEDSFVITYPDDITNWQTIVLAMNDNRQSGTYQSFVKSYKPISARLYTPKFLIEGDEAKAIGKSLNYTQDTLQISTALEVNGKQIFSKDQTSSNAAIDTLNIAAKSDTLQLTYKLTQKNSDYFDGEKRNIPVFRKGVEVKEGTFRILMPGDTLNYKAKSNQGEVLVYAEADVINLIETDLEDVINYRYDCNEQLASKLNMLLAKQEIYKHLKKPFKDEKKLKKIIRKLQKNKNDDDLWGWWKSSKDTNYWITQHVVKSLLNAKNAGYKTDVDEESLSIYLKNEFYKDIYIYQKIDILSTLSMLKDKPTVSLDKDIKTIFFDENSNFNQKLRLSLIAKQFDLKAELKFIDDYQNEDIFGNIYFDDDKSRSYSIRHNRIQNTLLAYQLIKKVNPDDERLPKIMLYLLNAKIDGRYVNTYQATNILETLLPDLLKDRAEKPEAKLLVNKTLEENFPFKNKFSNEDVSVKNTGNLPIYVTAYQHYFKAEPKPLSNDFEVKSYFIDKLNNVIKNGEEVTLKVELTVKKEAEYTLLNIPIPGGFDYTSKPVNYGLEDHREYFKHETSIFCSQLKEGNYTFEIPLIAKYSGKYNLNPAKIELMYFPTFYAHEGLKIINVK